MVTGLASAAAGMEAQQAALEALSNDIANVSTTGYKTLRVGFHDLLYQPAGRGAGAGTQTGAGAAAEVIGRDFAEGALEETGQPLDVALTGPGFIQVRAPGGGVALTRDGDLGIDADGRLRTAGGQLLQPPVQLPPGTDPAEVRIAPDGGVSVGRRRVGRIALVEVANPSGLESGGEGDFRPTAASGPVRAARGARLRQGALESSNVDLASAMTAMTDAQRGYEMASKAIQTLDEVLAIANGLKR